MSRQPFRTSSADWARSQGWDVGTRLVGDEGYGPEVIEITAIGRQKVLAVSEKSRDGREVSMSFSWRDWEVVA